jgi:pimeloyl-ACP methyl ester carboxylesterase
MRYFNREVDTLTLLWTTIILVVSLSLAGNASAVESQPPRKAPEQKAGTRAAIVPEPVFKGSVYISEAGMGNPQTVLLIHGIGDDLCARSWDSLIPELSRRYHVVSFDLPGFCRSSKQNALYSPELYADFIKWVATTYAQRQYIVIGHSMGGAIALRFAAKYPAELQRLIIVDAAGILHRSVFTKYALQLKSPPDSFPLWDVGYSFANKLSRATVDTLEQMGSPVDLNTLISSSFLREKMLGADPQKIAALALMQENFSKSLETIHTPTLIIWGTDDAVAPLRTAKLLYAKLPDSRLELIDSAGHTPMLSRPKQFNRIVLDELARPSHSNSTTAGKVEVTVGKAPQGKCNQQEDLVFTGAYSSLTIVDCRRVRINDVTTTSLAISGSTHITIENSQIEAQGVGMALVNSELTLTDVTIKADTAITASNSNLDLAGVELVGTTAAATTTDSSSLLFSVSKVRSPHGSGYMHGLYNLTADKPL